MPGSTLTDAPPRRSAPALLLLACVVWLVAIAAVSPGWDVALLWFGALVCAPMALRLAALPPAAAIALGALGAFLVAGHEVPWLVLPWTLATLACAAVGALRLYRDGLRRASALADAGLLAFGAAGLSAAWSALQLPTGGVAPIMLALLAPHQLFAGLVLLVVASRVLVGVPAWLALPVGVGLVGGNAAVALGIAGVPYIEFPAVCVYSACVIVLGWVQLWHALRPGSRLRLPVRTLLVVSDLALGTAMTLAIIYAWGVQRGLPTLTIPQMLAWHAPLQVFGFALCGLAGWHLARARFEATSHSFDLN